MKQALATAIVLWLPVCGFCQNKTASVAEEADIRMLISQLVVADQKADFQFELQNGGDNAENPELQKRYEACHAAYKKLSAYKEKAIPFLVEHLNDDRQSAAFRNHNTGCSVGSACYWNIYYQLQDLPKDYSSYGYSRKGRDGQQHEKPYWRTPFGKDGDVKLWLQQNQQLSYPQKQIKCLTWLLEKEKAIGAWDAESYFENILPLEIRILERKLESGDKVEEDLNRLRHVLKEKDASAVPPELLPGKPKP